MSFITGTAVVGPSCTTEWARERAEIDKGTTRKRGGPQHHGASREHSWTDDGTRQPRSVTFVIESPSVRYRKRYQDEKPLVVVVPLVRECTPPGGLVLDCFAG